GQILHAAKYNGFPLEDLLEHPGKLLSCIDPWERRKAGLRPAMGDNHGIAAIGKLAERTAVEIEKFYNALKSVLDFFVHLLRRQVNETGGKTGKQRLKAEPLFQCVDHLFAIGDIDARP